MIRPLLLALALAPGPASAARLDLDARVLWSETDPAFGGFSAIELQDGGEAFTAISDRGHWATGALARRDGRLAAVTLTGFGPLHGVEGRPLEDDDVDAEGLAVDKEGRFYVSFEAFHRIRRYDAIDAPPTAVQRNSNFRRLQANSGLEALAIDTDGTLYAVPERSGAMARPFPVHRLRNGAWDRTLRLPRSGTFLVAGADFGPDGRLYLLERDFKWLGGFATRIRRFTLGEGGFDAGETLLKTDFGSPDNYEGISVWRDAEGETRVTLIADDNFFALQSTVIAEYRLIEG